MVGADIQEALRAVVARAETEHSEEKLHKHSVVTSTPTIYLKINISLSIKSVQNLFENRCSPENEQKSVQICVNSDFGQLTITCKILCL